VGGLFTGPTTDAQVESVRRAAELGINWFDTAPQYGQGNSEKNLGLALQQAAVKDASVSTKVRLVYEDLKDIPGAIRRSAEASLERLGMDRAALVQLHNPIAEVRGTRRDALGALQDVLGRRGVLEGLERLRGERICQAIGFTGLGETAALKLAVRSGGFQTVQVYYNLLNPSAGRPLPLGTGIQDYGDLLQDAAEMKMGALAIRVFAAGALADPPRADLPGGPLSPGSDFAEDRRRTVALLPLAKTYEVPLAQAAVRFAAGDARVSTVLVGASDLGQIAEAAEAAEKGPLPPEFLEEWERLLGVGFQP
jgi:aryl-alcohol dehydrogenase-like predicted oxidoreductase